MNDVSRRVIIALDSDVMGRADLRGALIGLAEYLEYRGATVQYCMMPPLPDGAKCGVDDFFVAGNTLADLEARVADALPDAEEEWEEPIPLDDPFGPALPLDALPDLFQDLVLKTEEQLQVPRDYPFCAAMGTVSAASCGKYETVYEPSDWHVSLNTQGVMVGDPSDGKSPVMNALVFPPIRAWETAERERLRPSIEAWQSKERVLRRQLDAAEKADGKPDKDGHITDGTAIREAALLELRDHLKTKQVYPDVFGSNATPEAVEKKIHEQGGAYAILSAESPFLSNAIGGLYSDSPNLEVILQGWEGDHLSNERSGREEDLEVTRAYLTILCCVQPSVLRRAGREEDTIARGVAARLLPVVPKSRTEDRTLGGRVAISPETIAAWEKVLKRLLEVERGEHPKQLVLSHEAERVFAPWYDSISPRMRNQNAAMKGWLGKMAAQALKIAGQFHVVSCENPESVRLSAETMRNAIRVAEYFLGHAEIMIGIMMDRRAGEPSEARHILETIREILNDDGTTTKRDLHRKLQARIAFQRVEDLEGPLALLEENGWVRQEPEYSKDGDGKRGRGRPRIRISLNPLGILSRTMTKTTKTSHDARRNVSVGTVTVPLNTPPNVAHIGDHRPAPFPPTGTDGLMEVEI